MRKRIPVFRKDQKLVPLDLHACAIREHTADGVSVGRCYHYVGVGKVCPRHGDVSDVQDRYERTGKLTDDIGELR